MYFSVATVVAVVFAGIASACSQLPVGSTPSGNPIGLPTLNQVVPAGKPFTITWNVRVSLPSVSVTQCWSLHSLQPRAKCQLSSCAVHPRMSFQLTASPTQSPTPVHSRGHLPLLSLRTWPITVSRSSWLAPANFNIRHSSGFPTLGSCLLNLPAWRLLLPSPRQVLRHQKLAFTPLLKSATAKSKLRLPSQASPQSPLRSPQSPASTRHL